MSWGSKPHVFCNSVKHKKGDAYEVDHKFGSDIPGIGADFL